MKEMKEVEWSKMNIGMGSVVTEKFRDIEENNREVRSGKMMKGLVGCVQFVAEKKTFLVKLKYKQKRDIISCSILYVCSKE